MFDANMRHLPKGTKFFAKTYSTGNLMFAVPNKMYMCEMLEDDSENPVVDFGFAILRSQDCDESFLVFEGRQDLTGFISKESLLQAKKLLDE